MSAAACPLLPVAHTAAAAPQVDKFSGKTYYWNVLTDEKTW